MISTKKYKGIEIMRKGRATLLATGMAIATILPVVGACSSENESNSYDSKIEVTPKNAVARDSYLQREATEKLQAELDNGKVTKAGGLCIGYTSTVGYNMVLDPYVFTVDTSDEIYQYFGLVGSADGVLGNLVTAPGPSSYTQKDPSTGQQISAASIRPPGLQMLRYDSDVPKTEIVDVSVVSDKTIPGTWQLVDEQGDPVSFVKTVGPTQPTDFRKECETMLTEFESATK